MPSSKKFRQQDEQARYPHIGNLIKKELVRQNVDFAELAGKLQIHRTGPGQYVKQMSVQVGVLWKIGLALNHNFFAKLAASFPVAAVNEAHEAEVAALKKELEEVKIQMELYKDIVKGSKG